jgi:hypothetical protein
MSEQCPSRRDFLKTSALAAAGVVAGGGVVGKASGAWSPRMAINPDIDNLRVVCCHDTDMMDYDPTSWSFTNQNAAVNTAAVQANLDSMAITLAQKSTASEAWATVFRKPSAKQWNEVKVAMKVNSLNPYIMPRVAVVGKICTVLNALGVPYGNMIIYDAGIHHPTNYVSYYEPFAGNAIPSGVLLMGIDNLELMGNYTKVDVEGFPGRDCVTDLANGVYDIIVNFAVNKGHSSPGYATLAMKNHYGTFNPNGTDSHGDGTTGSWGALITAINRSDVIVGGDPVRQQLCIIDSLWAHSSGVQDPPNCAPARLIMGTFAPVIDYLTIMRLRIPVMGSYVWEPETRTDGNGVQTFATDFGYALSEYQALDFVTPGGAVPASPFSHAGRGGKLTFSLSARAFRPARVSLPVPLSGRPWTVSITDVKGRMVREFTTRGNLKSDMSVAWDGAAQSGMTVPQGTYAVRVRSGDESRSGSITCVRR